MSCVVFGASGLVGHNLLPRLCARTSGVVAVSRRAHAAARGVTWVSGTLPGRVPAFADAPDAVVSLGPLDHFSTWLEAATVHDGARVIALSSLSALTKRDSPDPAERALSARLRDAEQRVLARCLALGSACTILRATLIYGGPGGSLERLAARARQWHVFPLPHGEGLRQPVHAADLALAVLAALDRPAATGIFEAGGARRLTASAMFATARRRWAPRSVGLPLPAALCTVIAAVAGRGRGMASRLGRDLLADNDRLQRELGVRPRGFPAGEGDGPA